ncbi:MAG: AAA family ATPase [Erythrobacter sp.]
MSGANELPPAVQVIAQASMLDGIDGIGEQVTAIECAIDAPLPVAQILGASIVVIEVDPSSRNSLDRIDHLRSEAPDTPIIAGLSNVDIATTRKLLRKGVSDIVALPFAMEELVTAIVDAAQKLKVDDPSELRLAPFVAVMKTIGGTGSTTIATHLAAQMAQDMGEGYRACLIDLDLQSGDIASYMGCGQRRNLADLLEAEGRLDGELLSSVVCEANDYVDVIAAPSDIVPIESIEFDQLMRVVATARKHYDLVIVDLPDSFTNWSLSTVFAADLTLMVGTLTIPSLRHAKRQLDFLTSMGIDRASIGVVLNRIEKRLFASIGADDAETALKHPVLASISEDSNLLRTAQDQGELVDAIQKRSKFSKEMRNLADLVSDRLAEVE